MSTAAQAMKQYPKGSVIVQENDEKNKNLYIFLQGNVGVYKNFRMNTEQMIAALGQGSFYGEMSLFLGKIPEYTVVALTDVLLLCVAPKEIGGFLMRQPDMALNIVEHICQRLESAESELARLRPSPQADSARTSKLFPPNHKSYQLRMDNTQDEFLYEQLHTCPICAQSFTGMAVLGSRLRMDRTDKDLRVRYKDFEPIYYDIVTCPNCFLSTPAEQFSNISKRWAGPLEQKLGPYKLDLHIKTGIERDTFTVFAGYYLAILCASVCLDEYQLQTGGLWIKLSRLYSDCGDETMQRYACEKALADYLYAYDRFKVPGGQNQQLCYLIGDLYEKLGKIEKAQTFFYEAKTDPAGSNVLKRQADLRLEEIREGKKQDA